MLAIGCWAPTEPLAAPRICQRINSLPHPRFANVYSFGVYTHRVSNENKQVYFRFPPSVVFHVEHFAP